MAGRAATTTSHASFGALHAKLLRARASLQLRNYSFLGAASCTALLPVLAAAFPRAVAFFLPLVASTSACCAAAYLFAESEAERGSAKEVVLVRGEGKEAEAGSLQVFGDANASAYGDRGGGVQVGCFLRRSVRRGVDEDGEEVVFAGRLLVPPAASAGNDGALEEELVALQVDSLAEGVWNSYFGGWSTWNHYARDGRDTDEEEGNGLSCSRAEANARKCFCCSAN